MRKNADKINGNLAQAPRKPRVSKSAARAIAERVEDARPRVLTELGWICGARSGELTDEQIHAIAAVMSHLTDDAPNLLDELAIWIACHGGTFKTAFTWAQSPAGAALVKAACTSPKDRRDLPVEALRRVMAITDEEAERLNLHQLAPKHLRDRARRRAEGVMPRGTKGKAEPWKEAGICKATYYRQLKKQESERETFNDPTNKEVGASDSEIFLDPIAKARSTSSEHLSYLIGSREVSPASPPPTIASLPTSEGRRYATLALKLGAKWTPMPGTAEPETWFEPDDEIESPKLKAALEAAIAGQRRARNIAEAKAKASGQPIGPKPIDDQACLPGIPESMWAQILPRLRARATILGGRFCFCGYQKIQALAIGVVAAERAESREIAIRAAAAARPELNADPAYIIWIADQIWHFPIDDAVNEALHVFGDQERWRQEHKAPEIVARATKIMEEAEQDNQICPDSHKQYGQLWLQYALVDWARKGKPAADNLHAAFRAAQHQQSQNIDEVTAIAGLPAEFKKAHGQGAPCPQYPWPDFEDDEEEEELAPGQFW